MKITPELLSDHGISADEFEKIKTLLGREPNFTELGIFSVMWSEHCSYKSSRVHLKNLPTRGKHVLQGPGENAGIIDIGDGWACAFKIESHNHPSYIEPFQGAATGVGGILRDVFTMGARPIAIMDSLRFGPIESGGTSAAQRSVAASLAQRSAEPSPGAEPTKFGVDEGTAARNERIFAGVVSGIAHYGNCFGVPNVGGETVFDACYSANPLVNAFALGIARHDELFFGRATGVGNPVIYVGAKTGRDGIHGATMASEEFSQTSEAKRPNVQVGDPFLEKLLLEACLEAMQTGAIVGIQDMGAAGLTSSSCEMGARAGTGIELDLDRVPQRESGMTAYEMMLSESQERMLLVAQKGREGEIFDVFRKWALDAVTVGHVTADQKLRVKHHGQIVAEIPNAALTDEAPRYRRPSRQPERRYPLEAPVRQNVAAQDAFVQLLASLNIASKRWIYEQYDSMVRTNTVEGPGGDAGVVRVKGTNTSIAMALDGNGRYCALDPREGARLAVAESARNVACTGAEPVAATNCLNLGNPEKPEVMWQLIEVIEGMREACEALETPITGGNVSLYNETLGQGIDPTPVVGVVGLLKSSAAPMTPGFRQAGRAVVLLDGSKPLDDVEARWRFGSTEYARVLVGGRWGLPPALDLAKEKALQACVRQGIERGWVDSAHDVADGGIAITLAECALARPIEAAEMRPIGARVDLPASGDVEIALFGESASRIVVSCPEERVAALASLAREHGIAATRIGTTCEQLLEIAVNGKTEIEISLAEAQDIWAHALERVIARQIAAVA